ncbi:PAS domain S-box protein [Halopiger aswanensis]|uniref:histidine kinase n=1 Tax=Halopiger aswanensis TaxID=148449 RepID=A0A3R7KLR1_9EURY|nr:PAS domain S-box protein [Halopiger aswanensis]RKD95769.1 PAS domain S-box-containing protein [Halopiger aswanensis]
METSDPSPGRLRSRVRQQEVVAELGQQALETGDVDRLRRDAVDGVRTQLEVAYCGVFEVSDPETLRLRSESGRETLAVGPTASAEPDSLLGRALATDDPIVEHSPSEAEIGVVACPESDIETGLAVAIGPREEPWGALGVYTTERREFAADTREFVKSVAAVLASAIENAETERRLREEAALNDRIVETSPVGIVVTDVDGTVRFANERAETITGRDRSDLVDRPLAAGWDPVDDDGEPLSNRQLPVARVLETGEPVWDVEFGIRTPAGERVWIAANAAPMTAGDAYTGVVTTFEDVTDERHHRRESRHIYRALETASEGISLLDEDDQFTYVNQAYAEMYGYEPEEMIGEHWGILYPDGAAEEANEEIEAELAETGTWSGETIGLRRDGTEFVEDHYLARVGDGGLVCVVQDVTDERRIEAELRDERALKEQIVETSPVGITVIDTDGDLRFANDRAADILGCDREAIAGLSSDDSDWEVRDADGRLLSAAERPFDRVISSGEALFDVELRLRHPDGRERWLSINGAPLRADETADVVPDLESTAETDTAAGEDAAEVTGGVFTIEDITEQKRLENELEATFNRISDAFIGLDSDWTITYANDRAETLIDAAGEGIVGCDLSAAFPTADESTFEADLREAMNRQEPTSIEEYVPALETWFEIHVYPSPTGLSVYFRDVTERKEMERERRATNRTLQRLYAITADGDRSFDEKIDELLSLGRERLGLETGFLAAIDPESERFEVTHADGEDPRLQPGSTSPLAETYCQQTIQTDGLLAFTDRPTEHVDDRAYEAWDLDCYLGGQITVDGDRYGTLCFVDDEPRSTPFTRAEKSFVELVTQWVSYELERRRHQRHLEESERRYRTLVEQFPNGLVALFDDELRYTLGGGQALEEIDLSVSEFVGQTVTERYEGETREQFESNFRAALDGEQRTFEFQLHEREWLAYAVPVEDSRGEVFAGMLMVQDITERVETERQLRERERRLEQFKRYTDDVLDAIDDVFYVIDEDGTVQRWNESLRALTGLSDDELEGINALEFFEGEDEERVAAAIDEVFETGSARLEAEVEPEPGGQAVPYEFVASALEDPSGEPVLTGIGRDISERREHERRLEALVDDLEESNERLEQFAYAASHDLQEPLRMISSYLTLLERRYADDLDDDAHEFIEFAVDGATRMQEMIDGLLQYSRVDTQGQSFQPVEVDEVVTDVCTDLEMRIEETGAEIDVGGLPEVHGDPGQLRQLFQNLIDNAITYSGEETPRISVFAEKREATWVISVRDQGIGIDPDDVDRIFRVFDRLHSVEEYDGTGIGLALCQRIAERHGGTIRVDSDPGEGSTFSVHLPTRAEREDDNE